MTPHQWSEVFHWMGLLPLLWLLGLRFRHAHPQRHFWWLALAFGVSWLADWTPHFRMTWLGSVVYPVSQAGIVGLVLLDPEDAIAFLSTLVVAGIASVALSGEKGPDVLLSSVAFLGVAGAAIKYRNIGRLWLALVVYFGGSQVAWLALSAWIAYCHGDVACLKSPDGMTLGYSYHAIRMLGLGCFCFAALYPRKPFSIASAFRARERAVRSLSLR